MERSPGEGDRRPLAQQLNDTRAKSPSGFHGSPCTTCDGPGFHTRGVGGKRQVQESIL